MRMWVDGWVRGGWVGGVCCGYWVEMDRTHSSPGWRPSQSPKLLHSGLRGPLCLMNLKDGAAGLFMNA